MVRERAVKARQRAVQRGGHANAQLTPQQIKRYCVLDEKTQNLLERAVDKLGLSHRAYHRILKLARTIADLAGSENIQIAHVSEAISYRKLDRIPAGR